MANKTKSIDNLLPNYLQKIELSENLDSFYYGESDKTHTKKECLSIILKKLFKDFSKKELSNELEDITIFLDDHIDRLKDEYNKIKTHIEGIVENPLNVIDKELWAPFVWSIKDGLSDPDFFMIVNEKTSTYARINPPNEYCFAVADDNGVKELKEILKKYEFVLKAPKFNYRNAPIKFEHKKKNDAIFWDKNKTPKTLEEYWEKSLSTIVKARHNLSNIQIEPFTNDPDVPNLGYFDLNRLGDKTLPTPHLDSFFTQFREDQAKVIKAFLFSVFDAKNKGRQCLYMESDGFTGKTSIINAISNYLGRTNFGTMSNKTIKSEFWAAGIYDKRLVFWDDINNECFLKYENIKTLTGGGIISVNNKYQKAFDSDTNIRLIMTANKAPDISNSTSEKSRIIYVKSKGLPPEVTKTFVVVDEDGNENYEVSRTYQAELDAEVPHGLAKWKEIYDELCPKGSNIKTTMAIKKDLDRYCKSEFEQKCEGIFEDYFVKTDSEKDTLTVNEITKKYALGNGSDRDARKFGTWLESIGCESDQKCINGVTTRFRRNIALKSSHILNSPAAKIANELEVI